MDFIIGIQHVELHLKYEYLNLTGSLYRMIKI